MKNPLAMKRCLNKNPIWAMPIDPKTRSRFTHPLIRWYRRFGRDLPWRNTPDPYAIWISEIMLQQTQVTTVLPYYQRFLSTYPTIEFLAAAPLEEVLKLWQGLGYYARARHLHSAAQKVVKQFDGMIPSTMKHLQSLPGIGRSTAGAILTIAFGQRHPILDGNVRRVLCRFFTINEDPSDKKVEDRLWRYSEKLLPKQDPGFYLQAIMDLGATICRPTRPDCMICPIKNGCRAWRNGLQEALPIKKTRKKTPHFDYVAGVILYKDEVLIHRRPLKGLLAGLWEFPGHRMCTESSPASIQSRPESAIDHFFKNELNLTFRSSRNWMTIKHVFTHFRMTLHVFICRATRKIKIDPSFKWTRREVLAKHPFSTAHYKIVMKLTE